MWLFMAVWKRAVRLEEFERLILAPRLEEEKKVGEVVCVQRGHQRGPTVFVLMINVGASVDEGLADLGLAFGRCDGECCLKVGVGEVDVGTMRKKVRHKVEGVVDGGDHQRGHPESSLRLTSKPFSRSIEQIVLLSLARAREKAV
jgi:hypothetical protein